MIGDDLLSGFCVVSISARNWQFRATIWHASARPRAREDLDSINDRVRNLGHVPLGGRTHDRYNVDFADAPRGDTYDDGGC